MAGIKCHIEVVILLTTAVLATAARDLRCYMCDHAKSPDVCETYTVCGHEESCFTREYVDHHDTVAYHLGCESMEICRFYKYAENFFLGKRDLPEPEDVHLCFDCCDTDDCNKKMCTGNTSGYIPPVRNNTGTGTGGGTTKPTIVKTQHPATTTVPTTTTTSQPTTTKSACPSEFPKQFGNSCYIFSLDNLVWTDARKQCQSHSGSDLISVNSAAEDTFIVKQLETMKPDDTTRGLWLGGTYDSQTNKYTWVDGTDLTFKRYMTGAPRMHDGYNLEVINPSLSDNDQFKDWPWNSDIGQFYQRGYICELKI